MVSIPDWNKFAALLQKKEEQASGPASRYQLQREQDAVKQAADNGYFLNITKSLIEQKFAAYADSDDECEVEDRRPSVFKFLLGKVKHKNVNRVDMIKLGRAHLRSLGDLGICKNLSICILPDNFISRFDALISCIGLTKLDLHGNQITSVPGTRFWANMMYLRVVNLHDNPVGHMEALQSMAASPSLVALTMYDTPLSLKRNYRHHVVNSLWTLKALDNYVISDEEIIEDARFRTRFAALSEPFHINLCPPMPQESNYFEEMEGVRQLLLQIDCILAHWSPVIIIQRYYRGHRVRRQLGKQGRFHSNNLSKTVELPPLPMPEAVKVPEHVQDSSRDESLHIDYDSYMRSGRRPGSAATVDRLITDRPPWPEGAEVQDGLESQVRLTSDADGRLKKNLFMNLNKLQGTLISLHDDSETMVSVVSKARPPTERSHNAASRKPKEPKKAKFQRIKDIRQFFGPVVRAASPEREESYTAEELPRVRFRLRGLQKRIIHIDPVFDMIMGRREAGHEVRLAEADYHRHTDCVPRPKIQQKKPQSNEERYFARTQGTMGLSSLRAVQQAYKDRDSAERQSAKVDYITSLRDQRELAKSRHKLFQEEKRTSVLRERVADRRHLVDAMEQREMTQLEAIDRAQEHRSWVQAYHRQLRNELTFTSDFKTQNTSVSNALIRHDRQTQRDDQITHKTGLVTTNKQTDKEKQDIVKKYMEHRRLMRQTESAVARAALDTKMLTEANNRLLAAKTRVAGLKARHATMEVYTMPAVQSPNLQDIETRLMQPQKPTSMFHPKHSVLRTKPVATNA